MLAPGAQLLVERGHAASVKIGELPEVVDAEIVEALLQLRADAGDALEVVGFAARRIDAFEGHEGGRDLLDGRGLGGSNVDAGRGLATLDAVEGGARDEIAIERDGAAGVVIAGYGVVDAVRIAVGVDDRDDRDFRASAPL